VTEGKADAVSLASLLHYKFIENDDRAGDFSSEGNVEFLKSRRGPSKIRGATLPEVKTFLRSLGIQCRPAFQEGVNV